MRISKVSPVIATPKINKRKPKEVIKYQYLGETDPAVYIHSNKTHRSVSEAFRDAEYACAITKFKSDFQRTTEYIGWVAMWVMVLGGLYLLMTAFDSWAK
jgi:hypothetical protein